MRFCTHCGEPYEAVSEFRGYARRYCSRKCCGLAKSVRERAAWPDEATMRELFVTQGLSDRAIAKIYGRSYNWVLTIRKAYGIAADDKPSKPPARFKSSHGYIRVGDDYEHRVVAAGKIGRPLSPGEHVHHVDGNKTNNAPENLEVLTESAHHKLHARPKKPRTKADHSVYRYFSLGLKGNCSAVLVAMPLVICTTQYHGPCTPNPEQTC